MDFYLKLRYKKEEVDFFLQYFRRLYEKGKTKTIYTRISGLCTSR